MEGVGFEAVAEGYRQSQHSRHQLSGSGDGVATMSERSTRARPPGGGLVGRNVELSALLCGVDSALRGSATMIMVSGAAGTGKTALLDACARVAVGVRLLRGTCSPADGHRPYHAVRLLLGLDQETSDVPLSHRLSAKLTDLARSGPVGMVLDDVQWCDEASVAWLEMVVRRDSGLPLLVLLARRTSAHWPLAGAAFGAAAARCRVVRLGPLRGEDIAGLARRVWETRPHPEFVRACAAGSRGSPRLALRLFDRLRAGGLAPVGENAPAAAEAALALFAEEMPAALDREPVFVRQVIEAAAVLGSADWELVGMLSGVPERLVDVALEVLREQGLLDCPHGVVLAAAVDDLDGRRRRAARILNDAGHPPVEVGAQLVELADLDEPWMRPMLREAAVEAERAGRPGTAIRFLRGLLAAGARDVLVLTDFARVAEERDPAAVYAALLDGLEWTDEIRDLARIGVRLGRVAVILGRAAEVVGTLARIADGLAATADLELRAGVEAAQRTVALWQGSAAPRPSDVDGRTGAEREVLALRAVASVLSGDPAAAGQVRRALAVPPPGGWAFALAGYVLSLVGDSEEALRSLAGADREAPWSRGIALSVRALVRVESGDLVGARLDAAAAMDATADFVEPATAARTAMALVCARGGEVAEGGRLIDGLTDAPPLVHPPLLAVRASLAELRGADEEALALLTRCGTLPGAVLVPWWLDATRLLVRLGRRAEARELVVTGEELADRWGTATARGLASLGRGVVDLDTDALGVAVDALAGVPWYLTRARILLGGASLREDDRAAARGHFREAVDLAARCGFRPLAKEARSGLLAAGGRWRARTAGASGVLTDGERRVAELAASGATNREIAETLLVALRTVEIHLTSAYRKLGVTGRTELAAGLAGRRPS